MIRLPIRELLPISHDVGLPLEGGDGLPVGGGVGLPGVGEDGNSLPGGVLRGGALGEDFGPLHMGWRRTGAEGFEQSLTSNSVSVTSTTTPIDLQCNTK